MNNQNQHNSEEPLKKELQENIGQEQQIEGTKETMEIVSNISEKIRSTLTETDMKTIGSVEEKIKRAREWNEKNMGEMNFFKVCSKEGADHLLELLKQNINKFGVDSTMIYRYDLSMHPEIVDKILSKTSIKSFQPSYEGDEGFNANGEQPLLAQNLFLTGSARSGKYFGNLLGKWTLEYQGKEIELFVKNNVNTFSKEIDLYAEEDGKSSRRIVTILRTPLEGWTNDINWSDKSTRVSPLLNKMKKFHMQQVRTTIFSKLSTLNIPTEHVQKFNNDTLNGVLGLWEANISPTKARKAASRGYSRKDVTNICGPEGNCARLFEDILHTLTLYADLREHKTV